MIHNRYLRDNASFFSSGSRAYPRRYTLAVINFRHTMAESWNIHNVVCLGGLDPSETKDSSSFISEILHKMSRVKIPDKRHLQTSCAI